MGYYTASSTSLTIVKWAHVTATSNSSGSVIYINGVNVGAGPGSICGNSILTKYSNVGRSVYGPYDSDLNAVLDELKIFNRVLNQSEIKTEMNKQQPYEIIAGQLVNTFAPPTAYTSGLTNYWPLSGSGVNVIGGKNLTIQSKCQYALDRFDNSNSALYLNGGYATIPLGNYFDCTLSKGYTIMAWIKLLSVSYSGIRLLDVSSKISSAPIIAFHTNGSIYGYTVINSSSLNPAVFSNISITIGLWTHVANTITSTSNTLFINGQPVSTASAVTCSNTLQSTFNIGYCSYYGFPNLDAVLDEFKIFNRALTANEIKNEMNLLEPYKKLFKN